MSRDQYVLGPGRRDHGRARQEPAQPAAVAGPTETPEQVAGRQQAAREGAQRCRALLRHPHRETEDQEDER